MMRFFGLIALLPLLLIASNLRAQNDPTIGSWVLSDTQTPKAIEISLFDQLSQRQRELINSGFTTVSQLTLRLVDRKQRQVSRSLFTRSCTIKFDLWEESYNLTTIGPDVLHKDIRNLSQFSELCMNAEISDTDSLQSLYANGGDLVATLLIDQVSAQKAQNIKDWLIRQQSGVMQNLFSHMLGSLKLTERVDVVIFIPPGNGAKQPFTVKQAIGSR